VTRELAKENRIIDYISDDDLSIILIEIETKKCMGSKLSRHTYDGKSFRPTPFLCQNSIICSGK